MTWNQKQYEELDHYIDLLTGIFLNEKASRIRCLGYRLGLQDLDPVTVLQYMERGLTSWKFLHTPATIRAHLLS